MGPGGIGLPWVVILGFVRLSTHPRVFVNPFSPEEALGRVEEWLALPHVCIVHPSSGHFVRLSGLLCRVGTADAHIATLAMERGLVLHTTDADFSRFQGLKWENPLKEA
ncbi:MAG: PIN domain-containing protein [Luteolibacter sp.]